MKTRRYLQLFVGHLIVCAIFVFLLNSGWSFVGFIDVLFFLSAGYLSIGLLLYVISKEFFDITSRSFHKALKRKSQSSHEYSPPSKKVNQQTIHFFIKVGSGLFFLMLVCLLFYYLL